MKLSKLSAMRLTAASAVLLLVSSCGGGASDTAAVSNVAALKMNSKVSIIDATASSSSAKISSLTFDSNSFAASMTSALWTVLALRRTMCLMKPLFMFKTTPQKHLITLI